VNVDATSIYDSFSGLAIDPTWGIQAIATRTITTASPRYKACSGGWFEYPMIAISAISQVSKDPPTAKAKKGAAGRRRQATGGCTERAQAECHKQYCSRHEIVVEERTRQRGHGQRKNLTMRSCHEREPASQGSNAQNDLEGHRFYSQAPKRPALFGVLSIMGTPAFAGLFGQPYAFFRILGRLGSVNSRHKDNPDK